MFIPRDVALERTNTKDVPPADRPCLWQEIHLDWTMGCAIDSLKSASAFSKSVCVRVGCEFVDGLASAGRVWEVSGRGPLSVEE